MSIGVFLTAYLGLGISLWPYAISFRQTAAAPESQSLLLIGTVFLLPVVLGYPILVGSGLPLLKGVSKPLRLQLLEAKGLQAGDVLLRYVRPN